ncbi:putative mediator of rna polymerase ii transcription subunit 37c [Quercus suber]|uniref:Mediator of rna polymerase ii transcription subunit 37c n=1 Tax=Quercus suber TaxID=58331 RepID=A0AAW0JZH6_QUESU
MTIETKCVWCCIKNKNGGEEEGLAINIDLGTTYSCGAVWQRVRVEIITNEQDNRMMPSYVAFTDNDGWGSQNFSFNMNMAILLGLY